MKAVDTILLVVQSFIRVTELSSALYSGGRILAEMYCCALRVCLSIYMVDRRIISLVNERVLYEKALDYLSLDDKNARIHD